MASQCLTKHLLRVIKPRVHGKSLIQHRNSGNMGSKTIGPLSQYTDVEICKDPKEWSYVDRLLPVKYIPEPTVKDSYPSGWKPTQESSLKLPFFVRRSRNHMPPIYLEILERGVKRLTIIKHIEGDIGALNADLSQFLSQNLKSRIATSVNEMQAQIHVKGDHVALVEKWFYEKGF